MNVQNQVETTWSAALRAMVQAFEGSNRFSTEKHCTTMIDLTKPEHSYLFGFLQGDGHLYRNREKTNKGKLVVEIGAGDRFLLEQFQSMFPDIYSSVIERVRNTNFTADHVAVIWTVSSKSFRDELLSLGLPVGNKSLIVAPPASEYNQRDYFRGLVDADGSLGTNRNG